MSPHYSSKQNSRSFHCRHSQSPFFFLVPSTQILAFKFSQNDDHTDKLFVRVRLGLLPAAAMHRPAWTRHLSVHVHQFILQPLQQLLLEQFGQLLADLHARLESDVRANAGTGCAPVGQPGVGHANRITGLAEL